MNESLYSLNSIGKSWQTRNNFKWAISLIMTNILVLIMSSQSSNKNEVVDKPFPTTPKNYTRLLLPLKIFIPLEKNQKNSHLPIALYSPSKSLLIYQAFLIASKKPKNLELTFLQVDIPENKLTKILPYLDKYLLAYPNQPLKEKKNYEVHF